MPRDRQARRRLSRPTVTAHTVGCTLAIALAAPSAAAGEGRRPLGDALHIEPGATCLEGITLAQQVASWLGSDTVDADVWIRVDGGADDPREVSFRMGRRAEVLAVRRFAPGPERCEQLEAAVGLAIALAIKVSLLDDLVGRSPALPAATPEPRDRWAVTAAPVASIAVIPGAAVGAGAALEEALPPNFAVRVGVVGIGGWGKTFEHVTGSFDAAVAAFRLDGCVRWALGPAVLVRGCAGVLLGGLFASGRDLPVPKDSAKGWSAAAYALGVTVDVSRRWSVDGELAAVFPFSPTSFGVRTASGDVVDARASGNVGGLLSVGPRYRF
jgi:hypothetical protein